MALAEEKFSNGEKPLAPESLKTRRAREKLLKQWEEEKTQITPEAIADSVDKIRKWIADNAKNRVPIKEKIELFNQNKDAAELSGKVQRFAQKLKDDMSHFIRALDSADVAPEEGKRGG